MKWAGEVPYSSVGTKGNEPFTKDEPVGGGDYIAEQGDCILSLAERYGFFWKTIWNHPENARLRSMRGRPSILLPGDRVKIPEKAVVYESAATDGRHTFVRRGVPSKVRMRFEEECEALANLPWRMTVDHKLFEGTTDGEGYLEVILPSGAVKCDIVIGTRLSERRYSVQLGHLDPWDSIRGVQSRLRNLGFLKAPGDGSLSAETVAALRDFQTFRSISLAGELDEQTCQELRRMHGS